MSRAAGGLFCLLTTLAPSMAEAQFRKIGEMELRLMGVNATVESIDPVVPKHTPSGVRIVVRAGEVVLTSAELVRFLGAGFSVQGDLSGPGLTQPVSLPPPPDPNLPPLDDPLVLRTPPVPIAGIYRISNLRIVAANGRTVLDVEPSSIPLKVIDQILVTQVTTRALTLDEIRAKGIVLDSDDYLGFEFTMGFKLDSRAVDLKFPVVFDRQGVAIPQPLLPPPTPLREGLQLPTIVPMLLEAEGPGGIKEPIRVVTPSGTRSVTIPAVIVIPGNIGFLKQFFSAQLYVSNGAPAGSRLDLQQIQATIAMPGGVDTIVGTPDDPLALPEIERDGSVVSQPLTMPVRGVGPDAEAGTDDDVDQLAPAQQAQAEFLLRGEKEGFHPISFDLSAQLVGLPIGPVTVKGKAAGGVLVRNASFNVTFTVPSVVRFGEEFTLRATVTNISKSIGNNVKVTFTPGSLSGAILLGSPPDAISTLKPGSSAVLDFKFKSQATGKVVASYLRMDSAPGSSGSLRFALGVGERGVPLSPDTLVLPADVSVLPPEVMQSAMRVLGQAWSVANAPPGSLPKNVVRSNPQAVVKKALALAEAGLRVSLGQNVKSAVRDLLYDFFAGAPLDLGFDQLLRTTEAGQEFVVAAGDALRDAAMTEGGGPGYEFDTARVTASAGSFISFGWDGVAGDVAVVDGAGRTSIRSTDPASSPPLDALQVEGALLVPLGSDMMLGLLTRPTAGPYRWEFRAREAGQGQLSITIPRADGSFARGTWSGALAAGAIVRVFQDQSDDLVVQEDAQGDGVFESTEERPLHTLPADGPQLLAAAVIGPETLDGAGPFGYHAAIVFDRVVGEASAGNVENYTIDKNSVRSARRQFSGRIVFAALSQPEGPYRPARISVRDVTDSRGVEGPPRTADLVSRLGYVKPGLDPSLSEFGGVVSGRVMNSDGTPLSGRSVVYVPNLDLSCATSAPEVGIGAVVTDSLGAFELRYVRKDQCGFPFSLYTKDPASGSRRSQTLSVRSAGQQIVADFVMLASGTAQGTVRNLAGSPVEGADVTVRSETDPQIGGVSRTDAQGRYSVSGITVGPITVVAARGNGRGSSSGRIDKANVPAIVDVTLDGGVVTVRGRVVQKEGPGGEPQPSAGAQVSFLFGPGPFPQALAFAIANADGRYEITGLPVGPFTIKAAINSRDFATATGVSTANDPVVTRDLVIIIPAPTSLGYIEGTVSMPGGSPAGSVIVTSGQGSVLSEANGTFRLPVIPSLQTHIVTATTSDRKRSGTTRVSLQNSGQLVTGASITLSGLGSAHFTVLDPLDQPLANKEVRLLTSPLAPCGVGAKATDGAGIVRFTDLPLGPVAAQVVHVGDIVDAARGTVAVSSEGVTAFGILRVETRASTVSGTVVNSAGVGVQGADVSLTSPVFINRPAEGQCAMGSEVTHRVRTGLNGKFAFTGIHPGRIYVTATDSAFLQTTTTVARDLAPGQAVDLTVTLANTTAGEISGVVYEPDGVTPAGLGVEVTMNGPLPDVTVVTNAAGEYRMPKIFPAGRYSLTARDLTTGLVERTSIFATAGQDARHDIRLKGQATVRVHVVTALGEPVESAYVTLREIAYPARALESAVSPATEGVALFASVFEGQVSIEVRDPMGRTGASGRSSLVIPTGVSNVETTVRVTTTGTVRGRFLRPLGDDTPIANAVVQLKQSGRILGQLTTSATEPVGSFEFLYVPAGPFTLFALDPLTGRTGLGTGTIEAEGEVVVVEFRAQAIGTVTGVVRGIEVGSETPLPQAGARVDLVSGAYNAATIADNEGRYSISGVPEGTVVVSADLGATSSGGFRRGTTSGLLLGEDATLTLDVLLREAGNISGRLFEARPAATPALLCPDVPDPDLPEGCVPAGLASVSLSIGGSGGGVITGSTDEDGRFSFAGVPAGEVRLTFESMNSDDFAIATIQLPPGETVESTVHLNGLGTLEGQGLDSSGDAASGWMTVYGGPSTRPYGFSIDLDAQGRFVRPNVPAGPYTAQLRTTTPGGLSLFGSTAGELVPNETESFSVQVQDSASVTGRVLRSNGTAAAVGASVYLAVGSSPRIGLQAQNDGRFTFRAVPLNGFTLDVADPITGGVARRAGVASTNGEVVDLGDIVIDDEPISVVSVSPNDGAAEIPSGQSVQILFSDALLSYQTVRVMDGTANVTGNRQVSADKRSLTLAPPGGKWPNPRELTIVVDTAVADEFGRHPVQTFTSRFHTADETGPRVVSMDPPTGAVNVANTVAPVITFDEPLANTEGEITSLVTLRNASTGVLIPSTVVREGPSVLRLTPTQPLLSDTTYLLRSEAGARDALGNLQPAVVVSQFSTTDTIPPVLTVSPAPGSATTAARPRISIAVSDPTGLSTAQVAGLALDGAPILTFVRTASGLYYDPPADLSEGLHEVTAFAYDNAGNQGVLSASFFADRTPPSSVELVVPSSGAVVAGTFTVSAEAADAVSSIQRVDIFEGTTFRTSLFPPLFAGQINSTTPPSMSEGFHTFHARAYDKANLSTVSAPVTFIVDNQPMVVTFVSPAPATRFRESIVVTATVSQTVESLEFTANGVTIVDTTSPYTATFDASGVPDTESFHIQALARSATGETGSATLSVAVDRTAPRGIFEGSVTARARDGKPAEVVAAPGAAEGPGQIEIRHQLSGETVVVPASNDGAFTAYIAAGTGDSLELLHVDLAGNRGPPRSITVAPPGGVSIVPTQNLVLWISADQGVSTSSGAVTGWADRSDAQNTLSQTTSAQRPTLVTGAMNGLPVIRFDGIDDGIILQDRITSARTVFIALRDASSPTDGAERSFIGDTIALADFRPGQTTWWRTQNPPVGNGATRINGLLLNGLSTARTKQPAVMSVVTTANASLGAIGRQIGIGAGGGPYLGDIAEVLVYDGVLAGEERRLVETYLMVRYAIEPAVTPSGTVNVTVKRNGVGQQGVAVDISSDSLSGTTVLPGLTNVSGLTSATLPYGLVTASVIDRGNLITAAGQLINSTLALTLELPPIPTALIGRIVAKDGATPIPGALVSVGAKQATTNAQGDFRIDLPSTGTQTASISFQGLVDTRVVSIAPSTETVLNHAHTRAPIHTVSVSERGSGTPIPGVSVTVCSSSHPESCAPVEVTDALGLVRYLGQPTGDPANQGSHEIVATTPDGARASAQGTFGLSSPGSVSLVLDAPGRVQGVVTISGGTGAPGVTMTALDEAQVTLAVTSTSADGTYAFTRLGGRNVTIKATVAGGLPEANATATVPLGGEVVVDFSLQAAVLDLTVLDLDGLPRPDHSVQIAGRPPLLLSRTTDASGRLLLTLPGGLVRLIGEGESPAAGEVQLMAGEVAAASIQLASHHPAASMESFIVCAGAHHVPDTQCSDTGSVAVAQTSFASTNQPPYRPSEAPVNLFRTTSEGSGGVQQGLATWATTLPIYLRQSVFVPAGGAFARALTSFTNVSDQTVTIQARHSGSLGCCDDPVVESGYFTHQDSFAVTYGNGIFGNDEGNYTVDFSLEIPAHSTRSILTFTTTDVSLAPSLLDLSAAEALVHLTEEEKLNVVNFDLPSSLPRALTGRVTAADESTPLAGATVSVGAQTATTGATGEYRLEGAPGGYQTATISYKGVMTSESFTIAGAHTVRDFVHPWAAIYVVRVLLDGAEPDPVQGAAVRACLTDGQRCSAPQATNTNGELRFVGLPVAIGSDQYAEGDHLIEATLPGGGIVRRSAYWSLYSANPVEIRLGPQGGVQGRVLGLGGAPAAGVTVRVLDPGDAEIDRAFTGVDGSYAFTRVGGASLSLRASDAFGAFEDSISISVPLNGETTAPDLSLPVSAVSVLTQAGDHSPLAGAVVSLTSLDRTIGGQVPGTFLVTNSEGVAVSSVPPGEIRLILLGDSLSASQVSLTNLPQTVTLVAGTHHSPRAIGAFRVCGAGGCSATGSVVVARPSLYPSESVSVFRSTPSVYGDSEEGVSVSTGGLVSFRQTVFVPAGGAFARSLTEFTNWSDAEVTITPYTAIDAYGSISSGPGYLTIDDAYSVIFGSDGEFGCGEGCSLTHTLTLPPRSTRALLFFTTVDPALIPSLLDLSATGAAVDLSQEERDQIVNFTVPAPVEAIVQGVAQTSSGEILSGATVAIGRGDTILSQGITAPDGAFSLAVSGFVGAYRVVFSLGDHLFEATIEILASGVVNLGPLQALPPSERGSVRVIVEDGSTASVENLALSARHGRFFGLDPLVTAFTDATGQAAFVGLIPGLNRIETPLGAGYVRVVAGADTLLRVQRGGDAGSASGRVTLYGAPVAGAVVVGSQYDPALNQETVVARATTDMLGRYVLTGLRLFDSVSLWAWDPDFNRHASSSGYVASDTEPTRVEDIPLATDDSTGSLVIRATDETTGQPLAGYAANLSLQGWPVSLDIVLDAQGEVAIAGLPGGNIVIASVTGPAGLGRESALVSSGESVTLNVPVGQRVALPVAFAPFFFSGPFLSEAPNTCEPFCVDARVTTTTGDTYEPFMDPGSASPSGDGRELTVVFRTSPQYGLQTTLRLVRRLYVPADGRFARIVDTIENVGDAAASANYIFTARAYASAGVVAEILGGGTIDVSDEAIAFQSDQPTAETTGFAIRGTGGQAATSTYDDNNGSWRGAAFSWENLSLNPGEKVAFMSFVVFDRGSQASSVPARLQALLDLSDSAALHGLTAADRALIVNWILP